MSRMLLIFIISGALTFVKANIIINEIMYNSPGDDIEFIELYNNSDQDIDLTNWALLDDNDEHTPCLLNGILNSNEYLVIAGDKTTFNNEYPAINNINTNDFDPDENGWSFGNGGDVVRLYDSSGILIDSVEYNDGGKWPSSPDGAGPSLELLNPGLDNSLPTSWDPSQNDGGTPGEENSVFTNNTSPVCKNGERDIALPTQNDTVIVTVKAYDTEGLAKVELFVHDGTEWTAHTMYNDGTHGDTAIDDSIYTGMISPKLTQSLIKYYAMATDDIGQTDKWPNEAPEEYHAFTVDYISPNLQINELLAINDDTNLDEYGEYNDWFEIKNCDDQTINLEGMYVSDQLGNNQEFMLPDYELAPGEYVLIWADNDTTQGALHTNFKLSGDGGSIAIFETIHHGNVLIHGWKYGLMSADVSVGFFPEEGNTPDYLLNPTPGASNSTSQYFSDVCINEFQCTSDFGGPDDDWIEVYNRGDQSFDLSGCFLSDSRSNATKWTFPNNTILDPGEFKVIYESGLDFGLSSNGSDVIMLTAADSTTGLDFFDFGPQEADQSQGRYPDGSNNWVFFSEPSLESPNINNSAVQNNKNIKADKFTLNPNYPNPFNHQTCISYNIPTSTDIDIYIYDMNGRQIRHFHNTNQSAGQHSLKWDGLNDQENLVSSGIYFLSIRSQETTKTIKMLLIK